MTMVTFIGTKTLREQYDRLAKKYMDILKFHLVTQKAVHLKTTTNLMENLDKQLAALGED